MCLWRHIFILVQLKLTRTLFYCIVQFNFEDFAFRWTSPEARAMIEIDMKTKEFVNYIE